MKKIPIIFLAFLALFVANSPIFGQGKSYKIIVNPSNSINSISKDDLGRIFMKKSGRFPDGRSAVPVDLLANAPSRDSFSRDVYGKPAAAVDAYWQQQIFSGKDVPPPQKNENGVIDFVRSNPNGIAYVSTGTATDGVKVIAVVD